jgi:hypothetical protein
MLRHVLAHNGGAEDVIVAHLAALLRPGGCPYLVDVDGTAIRIMATTEDLRRWDRAFEATARRPPTFFAPMFTAIGRHPPD